MSKLSDEQALIQAAIMLDNQNQGTLADRIMSPATSSAVARAFRNAADDLGGRTATGELEWRGLVAAAREIIDQLKPPIETMNDFMVATNGDTVTIQNPPRAGQQMHPETALRFAAWLVTVAGMGDVDRFDEILEAVRNA